jgi:peroxiredoxin Q/BCP
MRITVGKPAPDFALPDQDGKKRSLSDYRGRWVLLYFYPKDDTPGCTIEACTIRDRFADFGRHNAVVLGVSADSAESHAKFAGRHRLPFTLLADTDKNVVVTYDAWGTKKFMGHEYKGIFRKSFLITPKGIIAKIYDKVKPLTHAQDVIADLDALAGNH